MPSLRVVVWCLVCAWWCGAESARGGVVPSLRGRQDAAEHGTLLVYGPLLTLPARCRHAAGTLPARCRHAAGTLLCTRCLACTCMWAAEAEGGCGHVRGAVGQARGAGGHRGPGTGVA